MCREKTDPGSTASGPGQVAGTLSLRVPSLKWKQTADPDLQDLRMRENEGNENNACLVHLCPSLPLCATLAVFKELGLPKSLHMF